MGVAERKMRERELRRNNIIDAAEKVFFSSGLENATMEDVAAAAELSKGTIYIYFKNKDELFHAIICRGLEILLNMFQDAAAPFSTGIAKVSSIGAAYFRFYKEQPNYFNAMLNQGKHAFDLERNDDSKAYSCCQESGGKLFQMIESCVRLGIADGSIRNDLDPVRLPLILWGHSAGILQVFKVHEEGFKHRFGVTIEELADMSFQLIRSYLQNKPESPAEPLRNRQGINLSPDGPEPGFGNANNTESGHV